MTVRRNTRYYHFARKASLDLSHPGLQLIKEKAKKAEKILEIGCGEGTKLNKIAPKESLSYGIDISPLAIKLGRKQFPNIKFTELDAVKLPFKDNFFDLVYSAFTLEHLQNPQKAIKEMIRVCKIKGKIIFLAPNFGAPNRASPCFKGSRVKKLIRGFYKDFFSKDTNLNWKKVKPIATKKEYQMDWDTTIEPYLLTLKKFIKSKGLKVLNSTSFWRIKQKKEPFHQKIFKILGLFKIYPFSYWGPHLFLLTEKNLIVEKKNQ